MGTLKEEPLVRANVRTFEPIDQGVAQGIVALLEAADFILLGEVFDEEGTNFGLRNWKLELGKRIAKWEMRIGKLELRNWKWGRELRNWKLEFGSWNFGVFGRKLLDR